MTSIFGSNSGALYFEEMSFGGGAARLAQQIENSAQRVEVSAPQPSAVAVAVAEPAAEPFEAPPAVMATAERLAQSFLTAIQDLRQSDSESAGALRQAVQEQQGRLETLVEALAGMHIRIDLLTETVSAQQAAGAQTRANYEQLAAEQATLAEMGARQEAAIREASGQAQDLSASVAARLEAFGRRLEVQHEELSGLRTIVSETSPAVTSVAERLDRQAEAIRGLWDTHLQRESALTQLVDGMASLRSASLQAPPAVVAGL